MIIGSLIKIIVAIAAIVGIIIVGLIVLAVVVSSKKKNKKMAEQQNPTTIEGIIAKGRGNLLNLRKLVMKISNEEVRELGNDICAVVEKILAVLKEKPDQLNEVRQCLNYYLPTLASVLSKYERIEKSGINYKEMTEKVIAYLSDVKIAMNRQYENLFEDDKLDMSVEMEAMTMAARRDGLLYDESVDGKSGENMISLTL